MDDKVILVEVGPRDGLQNEKKIIPTEMKVEFINALVDSGLRDIEVTSFVSPKWVPQLADSDRVVRSLSFSPGVRYSALIPNQKGFVRALSLGMRRMAFITAASETFSQKNTACSIAESLQRVGALISQAKQHRIFSRVYVSCISHCPYEGKISSSAVVQLVTQLVSMGADEISLGDTTGSATPDIVSGLLKDLKSNIDMSQVAVHFHDTQGHACDNIEIALDHGVRVVDSSAAGLGGCPYAPGASGNVATENVVSLLAKRGMHLPVDMKKLQQATDRIRHYLK